MITARHIAFALLLLLLPLCPAGAQGVRRPIVGGGSTGSGGIVVTPSKPPPKPETRTVTYMALTKKRQWLSVGGESILAMLVAFDNGDEKAFVPPTVIKDEKVRLLKDKKVFLLPLTKLDPSNRAEIRKIESGLIASYAARKAAAAGTE